MKKDYSKFQYFLYNRPTGRILLKILSSRIISIISGLYLSSFISKIHIKKFIKKNNIDLTKCENQKFKSFNDCFTRKINFKYNINNNLLISPCDSKLFVSKIDKSTFYNIKGSNYKLVDILKNEELANEYLGGYILIFRLEVSHYHRYIFIDNGRILAKYQIKGKLHTVNPIAFRDHDVFKENTREIAVLDTENFDKIIQIEVGAMIVGKIKNHKKEVFKRGEEKGYFKFGGSTVILLVKKNILSIDSLYINNSLSNMETPVRIGEIVGIKNE